jgi:uncharacterized RDD family membrane protein YckC
MAAIYQPPYAPIHLRLAAWLLDNLIFLPFGLLPLIVISGTNTGELVGVFMILQAVYFILPMAIFHTTPAKRLLDMRITKDDGSPLEPTAQSCATSSSSSAPGSRSA